MRLHAPFVIAPGVGAAAEVGPCAEGAAGTGDDDALDGVVGVGAVEGVDQLLRHERSEGVELVGPMQGEGEEAVFDGVTDVLIIGGHVRADAKVARIPASSASFVAESQRTARTCRQELGSRREITLEPRAVPGRVTWTASCIGRAPGFTFGA